MKASLVQWLNHLSSKYNVETFIITVLVDSKYCVVFSLIIAITLIINSLQIGRVDLLRKFEWNEHILKSLINIRLFDLSIIKIITPFQNSSLIEKSIGRYSS